MGGALSKLCGNAAVGGNTPPDEPKDGKGQQDNKLARPVAGGERQVTKLHARSASRARQKGEIAPDVLQVKTEAPREDLERNVKLLRTHAPKLSPLELEGLARELAEPFPRASEGIHLLAAHSLEAKNAFTPEQLRALGRGMARVDEGRWLQVDADGSQPTLERGLDNIDLGSYERICRAAAMNLYHTSGQDMYQFRDLIPGADSARREIAECHAEWSKVSLARGSKPAEAFKWQGSMYIPGAQGASGSPRRLDGKEEEPASEARRTGDIAPGVPQFRTSNARKDLQRNVALLRTHAEKLSLTDLENVARELVEASETLPDRISSLAALLRHTKPSFTPEQLNALGTGMARADEGRWMQVVRGKGADARGISHRRSPVFARGIPRHTGGPRRRPRQMEQGLARPGRQGRRRVHAAGVHVTWHSEVSSSTVHVHMPPKRRVADTKES